MNTVWLAIVTVLAFAIATGLVALLAYAAFELLERWRDRRR